MQNAIEAFNGSAYQEITTTTTKKSWFSKSTKKSVKSYFEDLDSETERQFSLVLSNIYNTVLASGDALDASASTLQNQLNNNFVFALSRHEIQDMQMDKEFGKLFHCTTQDAWLYKTPINIHNCDFEIGILGCDNAIADRIKNAGYKLINQPETYKIIHNDVVRGKNSTNFMNIHKGGSTFPEKQGYYLPPNYDLIMSQNFDSIINMFGGLSQYEKYKIIMDLLSNRIFINN
jgi:DNA-binding protein Fis